MSYHSTTEITSYSTRTLQSVTLYIISGAGVQHISSHNYVYACMEFKVISSIKYYDQAVSS